jgi:hypothetical protein
MSDTDTETEAFVDDSPADDIDKAKSIGWKDPAEWKGNPPKNGFVKASEYLKRAETVIPIMKAQSAKVESELAAAKKELADYKTTTAKTIERMSSMTKVALDRQRTQLEDKYSDAIDAATEVGDKAQVRKLRADERKDLKEFDEAVEESRPDPKELEKATEKVNAALPKDVQATISEWIAINPWYTADEEMQALANARHGKLLKDKPGMTLADNLEETRKYVATKFPEKFGEVEEDDDEKPARGSRVEGGSRMAGGSGGSKYSKLPAEAKVQCDRFIKEDGLFLIKKNGETAEKDLAKARERYAIDYEELNNK